MGKHHVAGRLIGVILLTWAGAGAVAEEVELRNDGLMNGGSGNVQAGFAAHEIGAAVFNPPSNYFPLQIKHVQIFWRSAFGGQGDRLEEAIRFYQGGLPNPQLVTSLQGPILTDGFLNDFDVTPLNIVFNNGPFSVGLEFTDPRSPSPDPFMPSLVTDSGCQNGKNMIFAIPPSAWFNACSLGVSGDFVIRVIVETAVTPPEIACRYGNVNSGAGGPPAVVLTVNGSSGDPVSRELTRPSGPATVEVSVPPAQGNGLYALWIETGESTAGTLAPAFLFDGAGGTTTLGIACFCLPSNNSVSPGSCPCPSNFPVGFTSRAIQNQGQAANVCVHRSPRDPRPPVSFNVNFPQGTFSVTGIIFDPNASNPGPRRVSIMNTVVVHAMP